MWKFHSQPPQVRDGGFAVEVICSIPTRRRPIPNATAQVTFQVSPSTVKEGQKKKRKEEKGETWSFPPQKIENEEGSEKASVKRVKETEGNGAGAQSTAALPISTSEREREREREREVSEA